MKQREQHARCSLCNRPLRATSDTPPRAMPKTEDIDLQIQETESVLQDVRREREMLQTKLQQMRSSETEIGTILDAECQAYVSPAVDYLLAQAHEVAQKEAELAQSRALFSQAKALDEIRTRLDELKREQAELEDELRESRKPRKTRLNELRESYERVLVEVDFPDFRNCSINSQSLMPDINDSLYVHAGTALKGLAVVSYHLALLELARSEETFLPRMLVIDSPAVGDLNDENHNKLLRYIAKLQSSVEQPNNEYETEWPDWQIILTTRRLISELKPYVKAEISAPNCMLLRKGG